MAATKGVNHWNLLNSAKGRKLVHTIKNLQKHTPMLSTVLNTHGTGELRTEVGGELPLYVSCNAPDLWFGNPYDE